MELIFHGKFSLYDAAIFGCKYIKIPLGAKRIGGKVALSGNFNILRAKRYYINLYKACHKLFKWVKQHFMITNSISTSCSINIF